MKVDIFNFDVHGDERGSLIALEEKKNIPFPIKRVYYIFGTKKGVIRGLHAHKSLNQVMVCLKGSCRIKLDNGKENRTVLLNDPSEGLLIRKMIWREMFDFTEDCVLMVIASDIYIEHDYIRDYNKFLEELNSNQDEK